MLSLGQVQSLDVSSTCADPYARSKNFSLSKAYYAYASKFTFVFRQVVIVAGFSLSFFGAQLATAQLFGACLFYLPTQTYFALNTLLFAVPALLYFWFASVNLTTSPKNQFVTTTITGALVISLVALALRFNFEPVIVILFALALLALVNCVFVKVLTEVVPLLSEVMTFNSSVNVFNAYFYAFAIFSVFASVLLVETISSALPAGLETAASLVLLGCGMVHKAMPESEDLYAREHKLGNRTTSMRALLPFLVPAFMTAIPVFTVLLLTLERNLSLFPQLVYNLQLLCGGALLGAILSVVLTSRRYYLSQFFMPALATLALALIMAISPAANNGINADFYIAFLGAMFVFSNVQFVTRAQTSLDPALIGQTARLLATSTIIVVSIFVISLQPFLDTISATMMIRFLGVEIVVAGSIALSAVVIWQRRIIFMSMSRP